MATKASDEEKKEDKAEAEEPEMKECAKCGGSGKNSDGAECKYCGGEGEVEKTEADDEPAAKDGDDGEGAEADHEEPDGDEDGKKALAALSGLRASASVSAHTAAIDAKMVPRSKMTALETKVNAIEAERKAEKKAEEDKRLNALADRAGELGYFAGLKGEQLTAKRERFIKIARNEPDAADEIIASLPGARVAARHAAHGNPVGGRHSTRTRIDAFDGGGRGHRVTHGDVDVVELGSSELMPRAKKYAAENKVTLEEAMVACVRENPELMH